MNPILHIGWFSCTGYPRKQRGITLIELLIVVVIVSILAAIAYPSYQQYVRQSNRAEAKGILLETAQFMERVYTTNGCYHRNDNNCTAAANLMLPFAQSPKDTTIAARYNIAAAYPNAAPCTLGQCYILFATPTGTMAGDACGNLTLDHTGLQGAAGSIADCWQR